MEEVPSRGTRLELVDTPVFPDILALGALARRAVRRIGLLKEKLS